VGRDLLGAGVPSTLFEAIKRLVSSIRHHIPSYFDLGLHKWLRLKSLNGKALRVELASPDSRLALEKSCRKAGRPELAYELEQIIERVINREPTARHTLVDTAPDPTTRMQKAGFHESGFSPKISLNARSRLQHFQRPTPSHIGKNAPSLQGHGFADVTRSRRCGVSLTYQQICYVLYLVM
jgi:hypothetical protein